MNRGSGFRVPGSADKAPEALLAVPPDPGPRTPDRDAARRLPLIRWACLAALLLGEVLALTVRFDVGPLRSHGEWWAELVRQCVQDHISLLAIL